MKTLRFKKISVGRLLYHASTWLILGLFFISFVQHPEPARTETEFIQKIENHWSDLKNNSFLNGSIVISKNNSVIYSDGDRNERYMIGSLSKSFVGYYFFKNKQYLDSKMCLYIQSFCEKPFSEITIQDLLKHRNGFKSFFELKHTFYRKFELPDLDGLQMTTKDFEPEIYQKLNYSNLGYDLLSRVIELIEKKSFSQVIDDISVDAKLVSTKLIRNNDSLFLSVPQPYINCCLRIPFFNMAGRTYGSGGVVSTTSDLLKWIQFLKIKGVTDEINHRANQDLMYNYGLVQSDSFSKITWHNGAILGYRTLMLTTDENLQVVILTNHIKPFKFFEDQFSVFENLFKPSKKGTK